ncbi:MAG: hypothetical protein EPO11_00525 [Gammaproteobacteria bacterium]|nr:MAG: hypothetical protein EPO11_00525 [Gammaproteobacteria bacterium]
MQSNTAVSTVLADWKNIFLSPDYYETLMKMQQDSIYHKQLKQELAALQENDNGLIRFRAYFFQRKYEKCLEIQFRLILDKEQRAQIGVESTFLTIKARQEKELDIDYLQAIQKLYHFATTRHEQQYFAQIKLDELLSSGLFWLLKNKFLPTKKLEKSVKKEVENCLFLISHYILVDVNNSFDKSLYKEAVSVSNCFSNIPVLNNELKKIQKEIKLQSKKLGTSVKRLEKLKKSIENYHINLDKALNIAFRLVALKAQDRDEAKEFIISCAERKMDLSYEPANELDTARRIWAKALALQAVILHQPYWNAQAASTSEQGKLEAEMVIKTCDKKTSEKNDNNNNVNPTTVTILDIPLPSQTALQDPVLMPTVEKSPLQANMLLKPKTEEAEEFQQFTPTNRNWY